jgi:hypothetical protein
MRCLAVCQTDLVIRMLDEILLPSFEVEFFVESKSLCRRLHEAGLNVTAADPRRTDTYLKADVMPGTCVIIEDTGRRSLKRIIEAVRDAGGTLIYVLGVGISDFRTREEELKSQFPELNYLALSELFGGPLLTEFSRSLTRLKVQQYQRFFSDADRVLILLHNEPDPDALASGLALRNVLRRTRQTCIIAALEGVWRTSRRRRSPSTNGSRWWTCSRTTSAASSTRWTSSSITTRSSRATPRCSRTSARTTGRHRPS